MCVWNMNNDKSNKLNLFFFMVIYLSCRFSCSNALLLTHHLSHSLFLLSPNHWHGVSARSYVRVYLFFFTFAATTFHLNYKQRKKKNTFPYTTRRKLQPDVRTYKMCKCKRNRINCLGRHTSIQIDNDNFGRMTRLRWWSNAYG